MARRVIGPGPVHRLNPGPRLFLALDAPAPEPVPRRAIGLLGGSFNPAHDGHRYISLEALKRLRLDEVWWLVSPQNPLKPKKGMAPLEERLATARRVARHPRIRVDAIEARLGTRYSADTLARLDAMFPATSLVWLIGADNLAQLHRWKRWHEIFAKARIAVFDRNPYSYVALAGKAASAYAGRRVRDNEASDLKLMPRPAWTFIRLRPHPASGTAIRAARSGPSAESLTDDSPHRNPAHRNHQFPKPWRPGHS